MKTVKHIFLLFVLSIVLIHCKDENDNKTVKIGAVVFLTGPVAEIGQEIQRGLQLSADEINSKGGINGKKVELIFEDSKNTAKDAVNAYQKLITQKVEAVIVTGDIEFRAVNELSKQSKIPTLGTVCSGGTNMTDRSDYLFRFLYSENTQSEAIARFAFDSLKVRNAAILYPNNAWGEEARGLFTSHFDGLGGKTINQTAFDMENADQRNNVAKVVSSKPDAICIKGWGTGFNTLVKQIREANYKGYLLSDVVMGFNGTIDQTNPYNENAYFTSVYFDLNSQDSLSAGFIGKYKTKFNRQPDFWGGFAFDCLNFTAQAMNKAASGTEIRNNILGIKEYRGVMGLHTFDNKGDLQYKMAIKKISNGNVVVVKQTF